MEDAERNLKQALSLDRSNANAHNNLGVLLQRSGNIDEARRQFTEALQLNPGLEVARKNLEVVGEE
jgi:Flp pilus assembly protein TadD